VNVHNAPLGAVPARHESAAREFSRPHHLEGDNRDIAERLDAEVARNQRSRQWGFRPARCRAVWGEPPAKTPSAAARPSKRRGGYGRSTKNEMSSAKVCRNDSKSRALNAVRNLESSAHTGSGPSHGSGQRSVS